MNSGMHLIAGTNRERAALTGPRDAREIEAVRAVASAERALARLRGERAQRRARLSWREGWLNSKLKLILVTVFNCDIWQRGVPRPTPVAGRATLPAGARWLEPYLAIPFETKVLGAAVAV